MTPAEMIAYLTEQRQTATVQQTNTAVRYYNLPMQFDIETSSFIQGGEKVAIMYMWSFACGDRVCIGRTWEEFNELYTAIVRIFESSVKRFRVIVYVHNLQYEFQFIRKRLNWEKIFAVDNRKPLYALTQDGVEFRCSYLLSGCNLDTVAKNLQRHHVKKLVGNLDYSLVRHSTTPLTTEELAYSENDVLIVTAYIQEQIDNCGNINRIPLTKTGFVRNYCRNYCFYGQPEKPRKQGKTYFRYKKWLRHLALDPEELAQLRRAFQGGFTHANFFHVNKVVDNVTSFDFTSSYPAVMVASDRFPVAPAEYIDAPDEEIFMETINNYFAVFEVEFTCLESDFYCEHYLSEYKCSGSGFIVNNGRIQSADVLVTTTSSIDWLIISQCYRWKSVKVWGMRRYRTGYLPTNFVKSILTLYQKKTELKGVAGQEVEYMLSKEMLNSCYGMTVCTKELTGESFDYTDDGQWKRSVEEIAKTIKKYNRKHSRFLFYVWGLVVTAEQRLNLWSGILATGRLGDYVYSDTDSVKITNARRYRKYFAQYNEWITERIQQALDYHGLPHELAAPKTKEGVVKPLGVWDMDGEYKRFKTLGAKRYMVEEPDGKISITVAGVAKSAAGYLVSQYGDKVFDEFQHGLYIPAGKTGKQTHTYIDGVRKGKVEDYLGNEQRYEELSGIHLGNSDYLLSLSMDYIEFLNKEMNEIESFLNI